MSNQSFIFNPREDRLSATGSGFQLPRLTTSQRVAISLDAGDAGLLVFDVNLGTYLGWDGTAWVVLSVTSASLSTGAASPEGAVSAPPGSLYVQQISPTATQIWTKAVGSGNTGWI